MNGAAAQFDDKAARTRIRYSLGESLIVEASAGTGKTSELVRRITAVLEEGLAKIDGIAAVTFTHKAAGELKLRLRQSLDRRRGEVEDPAKAANLEDALARLEEAAIGTIHSFCAGILRERPVEAVVDPAFEEVSEQARDRLYDRAFRSWVQEKLNENSPGLRRALSRLAWREPWDAAPPMEQLMYAGRALIEFRDFPGEWARPPFERERQIDALLEKVEQAAVRMNDKFRAVRDLANWIHRHEAIHVRDYDTLESRLLRLAREKELKWKGAEDLLQNLQAFRTQADADLAAQLRGEMASLVTRYEEMKRTSGQLDFLDQLLLTRNLVRDNREVRAYLQQRFTHLFVDEFQDTDPLQAEIILLLASDDEAQDHWLDARPVPGKLFVVGDPKQSIYKFRRADVVLYQDLRERLTLKGVGLVFLTKSFRSARSIQWAVNAAFAPEMTGDGRSGQADYAPLEEYFMDAEEQPSVVVLPVPRPYRSQPKVAKSAIDECLPDTVSAYIQWLVRESGWTVRSAEDPDERVPLEPHHICILFRRFTNYGKDVTREYTRSLEARGLPHVLVGSKSFHAREEIETFRAALEAVEWPADELSVFATLKGSLFAIPDSILLRYRHQFGRLSPFEDRGEADLDFEFAPVREALALLRKLHQGRNYRPIAETVNALLEGTRAHAGFALRPGGQQVLANVMRIAGLARSFETEGGISFRGFVELLTRQAEKAESSEAPVLEEGAEGVRMMTVHAAKGLEFPVVILADITANLAPAEPSRTLDSEDKVAAMKILNCTPWELVANKEQEFAREQAEGVRVAYVAATRARDLLVIPAVGDSELKESWVSPLHKAIYPHPLLRRRSKIAAGCPEFGEVSVLERPVEMLNDEEGSVRPGLHRPQSGDHTIVWWDPGRLNLGVEPNFGIKQEQLLAEAKNSSMADYRQWQESRAAVISKGSEPSYQVFLATDAHPLPEGAAEIQVETLSTEREIGRPVGARFGTLVHNILRDVALDADEDAIARAAKLHGRLTGAPRLETSAAQLAVQRVLTHPMMSRARASASHHREWPLRVQIGEGLFEGIIDLAFLEDELWHVVDFKTDVYDPARKRRYEGQLRWYVLALERITGKPGRAYLLSA